MPIDDTKFYNDSKVNETMMNYAGTQGTLTKAGYSRHIKKGRVSKVH